MTRRYYFGVCLAIALAGLAPGCLASEALPTWYMAETADVIVSGKLHVSKNPVISTDKLAEPLAVTLDIQKILKGSVTPSKIGLHYQSVKGEDEPLEAKLRHLNGQNVIVFAYLFPDRGYYIDLYFGEDRVIESTPSSLAKVTDAVAQQVSAAKVLERYNTGGDIEKKVTDAIDALSNESESTKNGGINQLVTLGCTGVPFIIKHMRDYRPFHGDLALKTRAPDAFEGLMHYNPQLVYDALSNLLTYITGAYFYHAEGFETQENREVDYHGWVAYLSHTFVARDLDKSPFACKP
jgi:hypothetical protein